MRRAFLLVGLVLCRCIVVPSRNFPPPPPPPISVESPPPVVETTVYVEPPIEAPPPVGSTAHASRASATRSLSGCRLDRRLLALGRWSMGVVSGPLDAAAATAIHLAFAVLREPKWIGDLHRRSLVSIGQLHAASSQYLRPGE